MEKTRIKQLLWVPPLLLLLPSIISWRLWIKAFNEGSNQPERVEAFMSFFPEGTTIGLITMTTLITSALAVGVGMLSVTFASPWARVAVIAIALVSFLFTILNLFQVM